MDTRNGIENRYTGLILLSGVDTPGISSALFKTLEPFSVTILDIEQVVIRSRLILTVLIDLDRPNVGRGGLSDRLFTPLFCCPLTVMRAMHFEQFPEKFSPGM